MTEQQPPDQPVSPQFKLPAMSQVPPGAFDDPADRRRRMRMGLLGGGIGLGIDLLVVIVAVIFGATSGATGSDRWISTQIVLLAATILASPVQIIAGIVLAAVQRTRPFGVGFLIGSAIGLIIMAGACFTTPALAAN
jgi:hypothetical protein